MSLTPSGACDRSKASRVSSAPQAASMTTSMIRRSSSSPSTTCRLAYSLAYDIGASYETVYLFRPIKTEDPDVDMPSSMTLPSYTLKFPTTLESTSDQELPEWAVMLELEQSLCTA